MRHKLRIDELESRLNRQRGKRKVQVNKTTCQNPKQWEHTLIIHPFTFDTFSKCILISTPNLFHLDLD